MSRPKHHAGAVERWVGRRTRKEWLLLFAFRSWLFNHPAQYAEYRYCAFYRVGLPR